MALLLTGSGLIFPTGLTLSLFWVVDLLSDLSWPVYHKGVYWSLYYPQRTYTSPLGDVISLHDLSYHLYEDDTQLYVTFKTTCPDDMNVARSPIEVCISDVGSWMACNKLKLNSIAKRNRLVLNAPHRPQPPLERLLVCGDRSLRYLKPAILVSLFLSQKSRDTN